MSLKKNKSWKDALLKTGLPLEYLVAQELRRVKFGIMGEYHYLRPNEHGITTEFSVDIWAMKLLRKKQGDMWADLNCLVECKYCHPGMRWIFEPRAKSDTESLLELGIVHKLDHFCTRQIWDPRPLWRLSNKFFLCAKGIELQAKDGTSHNIERGRSQLQYGIPRLAVHLSEMEMLALHDEDLQIRFLSPILVTSAALYVLKRGLTMNDFLAASQLGEIAEEVPALILSNPYSHIFEQYVDDLFSQTHAKNPKIKARLGEIRKLAERSGSYASISGTIDYEFAIREMAQRILVVNYEHLKPTLKRIQKVVVSTGRNLKRIGTLKRDTSTLETWVEEYSNTSAE